jgi:hypothetical protein
MAAMIERGERERERERQGRKAFRARVRAADSGKSSDPAALADYGILQVTSKS